MKKVRVKPIRAANGRIQVWAVGARKDNGTWWEVAAYRDRLLALNLGHKIAGRLSG